MDVSSWRTAVPAPSSPLRLDSDDSSSQASSSDDDLPSLQDALFKRAQPLGKYSFVASNGTLRPSEASNDSPAAADAEKTAQRVVSGPKLVAPKAPPMNSLFIKPQQPAQAKKSSGLNSSQQHRQPREIIEIEDSPPQAKKSYSASTNLAATGLSSPSSKYGGVNNNNSINIRQPLTEISSSSSEKSIVQLSGTQNDRQYNKPSTSKSVYEPSRAYLDPKQQLNHRPYATTPQKPSSFGYKGTDINSNSNIYTFQNAKARIQDSFRTGLGTPLGRPTDPTMYASHASYKPPEHRTIDDDLSQDLDPEVRRKIEAAMGEKAAAVGSGLLNEDENAWKSLCSTIYTDMSAVIKLDKQPEGMKCKLKPHQMEGVAWLISREKEASGGGILADDMGLGKTIQSISLILANRPKAGQPRTTLIVAPVSLLEQWKDEIKSKTDCYPPIKVLLHHGPNRTKRASKFANYDVVLTNYETLRSDMPVIESEGDEGGSKGKGKQQKLPWARQEDDEDDDRSLTPRIKKEAGPILQTTFHRVILDEAHTIKNRNARLSKAAFMVKAKYRWCLTGTPIQNSVEDIYSLFKFLGKPVEPLDQFPKFKTTIAEPLKRGKTELAMKRLHVLFARIMLRRTKLMQVDGKAIIVLPPRTVEIIKTDFLDPDERSYYDAVSEKIQLEVNKFLKKGTMSGQDYLFWLVKLLRLRQICNHPELVTQGEEAADVDPGKIKKSEFKKTDVPVQGQEMDDLASVFGQIGLGKNTKECLLCQTAFRPDPSRESDMFCRPCDDAYRNYSVGNASTKIIKVIELLKKMRAEDPDRKALVFSTFTKMFPIMGPFLKKAGIKYVTYEGTMKLDERNQALEKIRNDPKISVILVSLKAGALGLNLTCCSTVFMMDLWWNPAVENQAIDRAHRMGQTKEVLIYKFVITNTVEERILTLQEGKKAIADAAIDGGDAKAVSRLSQKDILYLFNGTSG